jgi:hypothetical protein
MKKRALAGVLWFYGAWNAGAIVADALGLSPTFGLILGVASAVIVVIDPRGIIWRSTAVSAR